MSSGLSLVPLLNTFYLGKFPGCPDRSRNRSTGSQRPANQNSRHSIPPTLRDRHAGITGTYHPRRKILGDDRSRGRNRLLTNSHARTDKDLGADPRSILDQDGAISIRKHGITIIVIASAKKRSLRNAALCSDANRLKIQNKYLLANQTIVTNRKPPRKVNIHSRLDINTPSYLRPKDPGKTSPPRRRPGNGTQKKYAFYSVPNQLEPEGTASIEFLSRLVIMMMNSGWHGLLLLFRCRRIKLDRYIK